MCSGYYIEFYRRATAKPLLAYPFSCEIVKDNLLHH